MDPITATGLISLGKNLIENTLLKPNASNGEAFDKALKQSEGIGQNEGIGDILSQYGVSSVDDLRKLHADLRRQLLDDPALASARVENPEATIHLLRTPDGSYQASLSNGKTITLEPDSQVAKTAEAVHQISTFLGKGLSPDRPGAILLSS
jgi:hypothetical protein